MNKGLNFQLSATNSAQGAFNSFNKGLQSVNQAANTNRVLMQSMNAGMNRNRRAVQQLGFQMSDFAIQVAGGQSAMLAFVQQGGQILQFFGPFGAIMAALLAVFGSLYIATTKTGTAIDSLYPYLGVIEQGFRGLVDAIKAVIGIAADMGIWIVHNLDLIIITAIVAVGIFGVKWVAAMIASAAATWTLTGALVAMRVALLRTGIGALIVGAGYLIERFLTLARRAGGVSQAIVLLSDVATEMMQRIGFSVEAVAYAFKAVGNKIAAAWSNMLAGLREKWVQFLQSMSAGLAMIPGIGALELGLPGAVVEAQSVVHGLEQASAGYDEAARAAIMGGKIMTAAAEAPYESLQRLRDLMNAPDPAMPGLKPGAVPGTGSSGGSGGAVDAAKADAEKIKTIFEDMQQSISGSLLSGFKALTQGTKSFADAAFDMLSEIGNKIIDILMTPIFNNLAGNIAGGLGKLIPGLGASLALPSFDGGGFTGMGARAGGMDGRGGRLAVLHPNETVLDHTKGQGTGGQPIVVNMTINSPDAESFRKSRGQIEAEIARAVQSGARNR